MTRTYTLRRRAEQQAETRQRIVEAAVELHGTVGPALTTVSMVAERAGVQRHTFYAHFPDEWSLYLACSGYALERDPMPDAQKGQRLLVSKNCLKCHSWQGEGARVAGDLAEHREDYAPAARWAATTWTHAPRIAAKALARGIPYPRFSDDEMTHLVAFLRSGSRAR